MTSTSTLGLLGAMVGAWLDRRPDVVDFGALAGEACDAIVSHRLSGIAYDLASAASGGPATVLAEHFRPTFYGTLLRNEATLRTASEVSALFYGEGIPCVRLKGAELLLTLYQNPGQRPMDDVDLLIRSADVEQAVALLLWKDFRFPPGALSLAFYRRHHFHVALISPSGVYLELHWQLLDRHRRGRLDADRIVAESPPLRPDEPSLGRRLDLEYRLLYLALHLDKHAPYQVQLRQRAGASAAISHVSSDVRIVWLLDLALAARDPMLDRARLFAVAREERVTRGLWAALSLAAQVLGRDRFPLAIEELAPVDGRVRRWVDRQIAGLLLSERPLLQRWMIRASGFDHHAQLRPIRLLDLAYLPFGRAGGQGRWEIAEIVSGARMVGTLVRERWSRR